MFHNTGISKAKEYSSYLVARGHNPKTAKSTFDKI